VDQGRRVVLAAVVAGLVGTVLVVVLPWLRFAYRSNEAHVAIETAAFLIPALAAVLFGGRAVRASSGTDLILASSLAILAATNLCFSIVPAVVDSDGGNFETWAPVAGRLLGALGFAAAALLPHRQLARPRRSLAYAMLAVVGVIALIGLLAWLFADELPRAVDPDLSPERSGRPLIQGHWLILAMQVASMLLYAAATLGFLRRAERERDALLLWVAVAAALSGIARLNYFLFPSLYTEWVYVGDFLRLAGYIALLTGIGREVLTYQRGAADAAVYEERRRLARDLHDGLAQELAFIRSEGARLSGTSDRGVMRMATAAERALSEARMAITALTTPLDEPLDVTLARGAEAVAVRMGATVEVDCVGKPHISTAARQSLERIVREAVSNAVRHGQAKLVRVQIEAHHSLRIVVTDDGRGFDTTRERKRESFGMISMHERAEAMDGRLEVASRPGEGTTVTVVVPNGADGARGRRR
jgi:signal transduction histidine kinase